MVQTNSFRVPTIKAIHSVIDNIFGIITRFGDLTYGEDITQLEHVLQCGYLAREDDASDCLVAAALLHDIGQFIDDAGNAAEEKGIDARHEITGATFLSGHFPPAVTEPIRLHVAAKRYLCAIEPDYLAQLSRASRLSLELQGGAFNEAEIAAFRDEPWFDDAIRLRRYDDTGKQQNWTVPGLETWRPLLLSVMVRP